MAKEFMSNGCKVVITGKTEDKLEKAIKQLGGEGKAAYLFFDVTKTTELSDKVLAAAHLFLENRIDILVNSAGIVAQNDFFNIREREYDAIMCTNAKGTFFMYQAVSNFMIENQI